MSTVIARALTMIAVVFQSYFNWDPGTRNIGNHKQVNDGAYHLAGLVLARGGSKGIPRKNMIEVNNRPLLGRALDAMIESGVFTTIWVSTDDIDINNWVTNEYSKNGVRPLVAVHKRAAYTATDSATSMSAVLEFLSFHPEIDAIGLVQATSPFVQPKYLQQAANKLLHNSSPTYDSVFSATRSHQLRWTVEETTQSHTTINHHHKKETEGTKPLNFNPKRRPRRQDWAGEMVENGMFYFAYRNIIVDYQTFQSERSSYVEIPKHLSFEIDTVEDLEIARCMALKIDLKKQQEFFRDRNADVRSSMSEKVLRQAQLKEL